MPRVPRGEKRPADVMGNAVEVMRIATGEEAEDLQPKAGTADTMTVKENGPKGRRGSRQKTILAQRPAIAKTAARKRWGQP